MEGDIKMALENLRLLKAEMEKNDWIICSFLFSYKRIEYAVLVNRFTEKEKKKDRYALVKLQFIDINKPSKSLVVEANSKCLIIDTKILRAFFNIEYGENLGDILKQFTQYLGNNIPLQIPKEYSEIEKRLMVISLSKSDSEDPDKVFCFNIKRNPNGGRRTQYNSDKTKILRPNLFKFFSNDTNISFLYSSDRLKEKDDNYILKNFAKYNLKQDVK